MITLQTARLLDLSHTMAKDLLADCTYPWEALPRLKDFIRQLGQSLDPAEYRLVAEDVWVARDVQIPSTVTLMGPTVICSGTELRTGAFLRGAVLIGHDCVVGNSCELKNAILFDSVQVPHFNYVGDSILGYRAHTGAGAVTSNVKSDRSLVTVKTPSGAVETGLKKFGAILGDGAEIGCHAVLNPGTVIGRNTTVYPLSSVRGAVEENSIFKAPDKIVQKI